MTWKQRFWSICLLAGSLFCRGVTALAVSEEISTEKLTETLNSSSVSDEEKRNFLIEYLLSQRSVILDGVKTLLFALLIYILGKKVVKLCLKITSKWMQKKEVETGVHDFVMSLARVGYHFILIFIVAGILGVGATVVAIVGSAGLAIGLALQGSLSNLAGGVLILLMKPFKVGDYIIVGGDEGTVESIDIFYTRVSTTDNKVIVIPNGTITNANITNTTNASRRMLIINFKLPYDVDLDDVKKTLLELLQQEERIISSEPMKVVIDSLSPVKMKMQMRAWVKTEDYWDVKYSLQEEIRTVLLKKNIAL